MNALVVHESMFGNTESVARAIAEGLGEHTRVISADRLNADVVAGTDLLVIGGPTHAHGMSRRQTRRTARESGARAKSDVGVREALVALGRHSILGAAFDTRLNKPAFLMGSAARGIHRVLRNDGFELVADPESFLVEGTMGPLAAGELERAKSWGQGLRVRAQAVLREGKFAGGAA
jgi:hypothetical protein